MKRMKRILILGVTLLAMVCLAIVAACTSTSDTTFNFETNGGPAVSAIKVEEGEDYTLPTPDDWTDHVFEGWYLDEALSDGPYASYKATESSATFYAKWSQAYTVTLDVAGGSLETTTLKLKEGANIAQAVAEYKPTKAGCMFGEWYYGNSALDANAVMPKANITLTAHYMVSYTVQVYLENLNAEGTYSRSDDYVGYAYADGNTFTVTYAPDGFMLVEHDGDDRSKVLSETNSAANVFTAYYDRKTISLFLNPNGADGYDMEVLGGKYGAKVELPTDIYARSGYLLMGWSTEASGANMVPVKHAVYNLPDADPAMYTLNETGTLYAVWQHGYTDIFGGVDTIFADGEDIYLSRMGFLFAGEHITGNLYAFTAPDAELYCRVYDSGKFCYRDESREGDRYYLYNFDEGTVDENTYLQFSDPFHGIAYVEVNASGITASSYGEYSMNDEGYVEITFTNGNGGMVGRNMTVMMGLIQDDVGMYYPVFTMRNEEEYELGTLRYMYFDGEEVMIFDEDELSLTLDGFGGATINMNGEEADVYYAFMSGSETGLGDVDILYVYTSDSTVGMFVVVEIDGVLGFTDYDMQSAGEFSSADRNSVLRLDGTFLAEFTGADGAHSGYYYIEESNLGNYTFVYFVEDGNVRLFVIDSYGTFKEYPATYVELTYYTNGYATLPYLVMGKEDGKFELYTLEIDVSTYAYVALKFAEGTLEYNEETGLYLAEITSTDDTVEVDEYDGINFLNLDSFTFYVSVLSTSEGDMINIMIWNSYTLKDSAPVDAEETYEEAEGDGTLVLIKGYAYYTDENGDRYNGLLSDEYEGGEYQYSTLSTAGGTFYFEISPDENTFVVLDGTLIGTAYLIGADGNEDKSVSLTMDGKGNAAYADGDNVITGQVSDTGNMTETLLTDLYGNPIGDEIYLFSSEDGEVEFYFVMAADNDGQPYFYRENKYSGLYEVGAGDDLLLLDGYYFGVLFTVDGSFIYGMYFIEEIDGEELIGLYDYTTSGYYYFDVVKNEDDEKVVRLRGEEFGEVYVVENQSILDVKYFFDGLGNVSVYSSDDDSENRTPLATGSYEVDDEGLYTVVLSYEADPSKNKEIKGYFTVISMDGGYSYAFAVYYAEMSYVYINPADWSIVLLDGAGTAYRVGSSGYFESGYYIVLDDNLIYFVNDEGSDSCLYTLNTSGTQAEIYRVALDEIGYFTETLDSLVFTDYGLVIYQNESICYYSVDTAGKVTLYYREGASGGKEPNKYGFVERELDGAHSEFSNILSFDNKTFTKNDGARINFARAQDGTQDYYPVVYGTDASGNYLKTTLGDLLFTPSGSGESYEVGGYVTVTINGSAERYRCTVSYEFNIDREHSHYYILIGSASGGHFRFEIELNFNGTSGSTYTIKSMSVTSVLNSYAWAYYDNNGYGLDPDLFGHLMIIQEYGTDGEPVAVGGMKIDGAFGQATGYYDHNGNLISFSGVELAVSPEYDVDAGEYYEVYTANFMIDGYQYMLEFELVDYNDAYVYAIRALTRTQTFEKVQSGGGLYDIRVTVLLGSDGEYDAGMIYDVEFLTGDIDDDNLILLGDVNKALMFEYDSSIGLYYDRPYYVLKATSGEAINEYMVPLYSGITLALVQPNSYQATDPDTGKSLMVLINGEEVEIIFVMDGRNVDSYIGVVSTVKNPDDDSYNITLSDGTVYKIVLGADNTATITTVN